MTAHRKKTARLLAVAGLLKRNQNVRENEKLTVRPTTRDRRDWTAANALR